SIPGPLEMVGQEVLVEPRHGHVAVSEDLGEEPEIGTPREEMTRERVSELAHTASQAAASRARSSASAGQHAYREPLRRPRGVGTTYGGVRSASSPRPERSPRASGAPARDPEQTEEDEHAGPAGAPAAGAAPAPRPAMARRHDQDRRRVMSNAHHGGDVV